MSLLRNSAALFSSHMLGRAIRFLYLVVLARLLGPEDTGVYLYGIALYLSSMKLAHFGQSIFLSERIGKHGSVPLSVLRNSFVLVFGSTLLVSLLLALFVGITEQDELMLAMLSFVGALAARALATWVRFAYTALQSVSWVPRYEVIFRGLEATTGVFLLWTGGGGLAAVCALHFLVWAIEAGFALRRLARDHPGVLRFDSRLIYLRRMIAVSVEFLIFMTATSLLAQLSVLLLKHVQDDAAFVGQFGIAMQFLTTLLMLPAAVGAAFLPRLSRAYRSGNGGRDLVIGAKLLAAIAVAVSILAAAYGPYFIEVVLGKVYDSTGTAFASLSWIFLPYALVTFVGQSLNVIGKRRAAAAIMGCVVLTHGILMLLFMDGGAESATIRSLFIACLLGTIASLIVVDRQIGLIDRAWPFKISAAALLAYFIINSDWLPPMIEPLLALLIVGAALLALKVFNREDVRAVKRVLGIA